MLARASEPGLPSSWLAGGDRALVVMQGEGAEDRTSPADSYTHDARQSQSAVSPLTQAWSQTPENCGVYDCGHPGIVSDLEREAGMPQLCAGCFEQAAGREPRGLPCE